MSAEGMYYKASDLAAEEKGMFSRNSKEAPIEMLKELQIRHAFSPYATLAAVKTADIHFEEGKYRTASDEYRQFISDNPEHEKREHAMYRLAESFYRLKESHKRDQSPCKQAIYWSQAFLSYYPESDRADEIRSKIDTCLTLVAKNELEIAKFYFKRKEYKAARNRFRYLAENFPQTEAARLGKELMKSIPPEEKSAE